MSYAVKATLRSILSDATKFEKDGPWLDNCNPAIRLPFTLTHSSFQRSRRHRLLRENSNENSAFASNVLIRRNTAGFNRLPRDVTRIQ